MGENNQSRFRRIVRSHLVRFIALTSFVGIFFTSLTPLEDFSYDISFRLKPATSITNLVIISSCPKTVERFGRNNYRTNYARLLDHLAKAGSGLVLLDATFVGPDTNPDADAKFADAIRNHGNVILVGRSSTATTEAGHTDGLQPPLTTLAAAAKGWGHAELLDETTRRISGRYQNKDYAVWLAASLAQTNALNNPDPNLQRWLNFYRGQNGAAIRSFSFEQVLDGDVPAESLAGKIVFAGEQVPDMDDTRHAPVSSFGLIGKMYGVEIHATAFLNLIRNDWLHLIPKYWQWLIAITWALTVTPLLYSLSRKSKALLAGVAIFSALLLSGLALIIQWQLHWWWCWIAPAFFQTTTALLLVWRNPKPDPYLAFISYRTETDGELALLISNALSQKSGRKIFLDVKSLGAGRFDEQLLREIERASFFIIIVSPNSLARCANPDDWVLRELTHAFEKQKAVIPVFAQGFRSDAKQGIPDLEIIHRLLTFQGVTYHRGDFDGFINKLLALLREKN